MLSADTSHTHIPPGGAKYANTPAWWAWCFHFRGRLHGDSATTMMDNLQSEQLSFGMVEPRGGRNACSFDESRLGQGCCPCLDLLNPQALTVWVPILQDTRCHKD